MSGVAVSDRDQLVLLRGMQPDPDQIKRILDTAEAAARSMIEVSDLRAAGIANDDALLFHVRLLADRGLLEGAYAAKDLGIRPILGGGAVLGGAPLRLTAQGHEFAAALREPKIYERVKTVMAQSGLAVAVQLAGSIATQYAAQRLGLPSG